MFDPRGARRRPALTAARPAASLLLAGALGALAVLGLAAGCAKAPERALLTVGSQRMTVEEFYDYARDPQVIARYMMLPDSLQKKALFEDLVSYELLAEAGAQAGFTKDSAYARIAQDTEPRLLQDALYDRHIGSVLKVSEDEARIFYESPKLEYRLAVIMVPDTNAVRNVLQRLAQGETFANVARTASMDPGTAGNGGEIQGWLTLFQLSPAAEAAIAPLHKGQHTGAVEDRTGVYVFSVLDTRPRKIDVPFEQVKGQMMDLLESRKKGALVDRYLADLRAKAGLKIAGAGWTVVDGRVAALPDSLARWLGTDNARAGLSEADLALPLATWSGRTYTVKDLARDLADSPVNERPSSSHSEMFRSFVEGKAVTAILVDQARREGLDRSPDIQRQIERARSAYLVNRYVAQAVPPSRIGQPTPAQLDSVTRALVNASMAHGGVAGPSAHLPLTYAALPPQVQQQIVADWSQKRQQAVLKEEVARVKARIPPVVDQRLLQSIPWPVPAAGKKETA